MRGVRGFDFDVAAVVVRRVVVGLAPVDFAPADLGGDFTVADFAPAPDFVAVGVLRTVVAFAAEVLRPVAAAGFALATAFVVDDVAVVAFAAGAFPAAGAFAAAPAFVAPLFARGFAAVDVFARGFAARGFLSAAAFGAGASGSAAGISGGDALIGETATTAFAAAEPPAFTASPTALMA